MGVDVDEELQQWLPAWVSVLSRRQPHHAASKASSPLALPPGPALATGTQLFVNNYFGELWLFLDLMFWLVFVKNVSLVVLVQMYNVLGNLHST